MKKTNRKINLLYLAEGGMSNGAFESQVVVFLKNMLPHTNRIDLIILEPFTNRKTDPALYQKKISGLREIFNSVVAIQMPPILGTPSLALAVLKASGLIVPLSPDIIHARGHMGSYIGLANRHIYGRNVPLIADLRGVARQEFIYKSDNLTGRSIARIRTVGFGHIEKRVCRKSSHVLCVSHNFKEYLIENTGIACNKITVVPTVTDQNHFYFDKNLREEMRGKLNLNGRVVFVYAGGLQRWQMPLATVELFKEIKERRPEAFLLFLTREPEKAASFFDGVNKHDYLLLSAKYTEVGSYLNAADIGLLLREDHIVNRVAAPTKIGEYLGSGLPVIISPGIGDSEKIIDEFRCGIATRDLGGILDAIPRLLDMDRAHISQVGKETFGIDGYMDTILNIYSVLGGKIL